MNLQTLLNYTNAVNELKEGAQEDIAKSLSRIDLNSPNAKQLVKAVFAELMPNYAESSAWLAAIFYDAIREEQLGEALGAEPITGGSMTQTDIAIDGIFKQCANSENYENAIMNELMNRVGYEIARAAGESTYRNGLNDSEKPRYARVPTGVETCRWCIMLASRGFVYHSKKNAGELNHYHANCDCRIVPKFVCGKNYDPWESDIEGYDPSALYDEYVNSGMQAYIKANPTASSKNCNFKGANGTKKNKVKPQQASKNYKSFVERLSSAKSRTELDARVIEVEKQLAGAGLDLFEVKELKELIKETAKKLNE